MADLGRRIEQLQGDLLPLSDLAMRYKVHGLSSDGNAVVVAPMPWVAPLARAIWLYEPLQSSWFPQGLDCPPLYRRILEQMNGAFAFGLSLYGIPSASGMLTRSSLRPLSLRDANELWRQGFKGAGEQFHFGGTALSYSENGGYFIAGDEILLRKKDGAVIGTWLSFREFLASELSRAEAYALQRVEAHAAWAASGM